MPRHPEPHIRRAVRVLAMVGELHRHGYQRLRVMPFMSPSGTYWRCWIGPDTLFYRNHGAILCQTTAAMADNSELQPTSMIARYTSGDDNHYFGWDDAKHDDARSLAHKFLDRFGMLVRDSAGWSYAYAGWYQRLLGLAERGWLPVVLSDYNAVTYKQIPLNDCRPTEWQSSNEKKPSLPLPPAGKLQQNYQG
jgi:hypothetical protein